MSKMSKIDQIHLRAVMLCMSKTLKIHAACSVQNNVEDVEDIKTSHNRFLTHFLEFISLLLETSKMCTNYNVDLNMKSSNYSKIQFKPLI